MMNIAMPGVSGRSSHPSLLTRAAVLGINGYQRYLSPYKGFSCAYRVHHREVSCSHYVKRVALEEGLLGARAKVRERFQACRDAHLALRAQAAEGNVAFGDPSWLPTVGHDLAQAGTWCLPTPVGCCWVSS